MNKIIEFKNVNKSYDKTSKALIDVNLNIYENDIYGIVGSNGAGKSTILKLLSGRIIKNSGDIRIFNYSNEEVINAYKNMGFLIETPLFYNNMSGIDNLKYITKLKGININDALKLSEEFQIRDRLNKKLKNYSTGMRQRLGLVVAFMNRPKIVVLDEPINGLDPEGIIFLRNYLLKLNKEYNTTIIISSHILNELSLIGTRYAFIKEGKILEELTREELMDKNKRYVEVIVDKAEVSNIIVLLETKFNISNYKVYPHGEIRIYEEINNKDIQKYLVDNNIFVKSIYSRDASLEEYYINLMEGKND